LISPRFFANRPRPATRTRQLVGSDFDAPLFHFVARTSCRNIPAIDN